MTLAERLKKIRESLGYTQKEMAKALDTNPQTWQVYESGKSVPGGNVLEALARMGFNVNWLLTEEGEMRGNLITGLDILTELAHRKIPGYKEADEAVHQLFSDAVARKSKKLTTDGEIEPDERQAVSTEDGISIEEECKLIRDIIEVYESHLEQRNEQISLQKKARNIAIMYRHFKEHYAPHHDEVEISEYIDEWL